MWGAGVEGVGSGRGLVLGLEIRPQRHQRRDLQWGLGFTIQVFIVHVHGWGGAAASIFYTYIKKLKNFQGLKLNPEPSRLTTHDSRRGRGGATFIPKPETRKTKSGSGSREQGPRCGKTSFCFTV